MTEIQRKDIHWILDTLDEYYKDIHKAQTEEKQIAYIAAYGAAVGMAEVALSVLFETSTLPMKVIKGSNNKHYIGICDIDSDEYVDYLAIYDEHKQKEFKKQQPTLYHFCPYCGEKLADL